MKCLVSQSPFISLWPEGSSLCISRNALLNGWLHHRFADSWQWSMPKSFILSGQGIPESRSPLLVTVFYSVSNATGGNTVTTVLVLPSSWRERALQSSAVRVRWVHATPVPRQTQLWMLCSTVILYSVTFFDLVYSCKLLSFIDDTVFYLVNPENISLA